MLLVPLACFVACCERNATRWPVTCDASLMFFDCIESVLHHTRLPRRKRCTISELCKLEICAFLIWNLRLPTLARKLLMLTRGAAESLLPRRSAERLEVHESVAMDERVRQRWLMFCGPERMNSVYRIGSSALSVKSARRTLGAMLADERFWSALEEGRVRG